MNPAPATKHPGSPMPAYTTRYRLLLVAHRAAPAGGGQVYTRDLILHLHGAAHITLAALQDAEDSRSHLAHQPLRRCADHLLALDGFEIGQGYTVPRLTDTGWWRTAIGAQRRMARIADTVGPDVVHLIEGNTYFALWALVRHRLIKRTAIQIFHSRHQTQAVASGSLTGPDVHRRPPADRSVWIDRLLLRLGATPVVASPSVAEDLRLELPPRVARRLVVIPLGIDLEALRETPEATAETDRVPYLVSVSRLASTKRLDDLIDLAAELKRRGRTVGVRIIGTGAARQHLVDRVAQEGLAGRVELLGAVADPRPWMVGALALVSTSSLEGFGLSVAEALALGTPVIAADSGGVRATVVPERTGFLCPIGDIASMADATERLLDEPGLASSLGRAAAAHMDSHFDVRTETERFAALHRRLAAGRRRPPVTSAPRSGTRTGASVLARAPGTPWRRIGAELLLLPRTQDEPVIADPTTAMVWQSLDQPATLEQLTKRVIADAPGAPPGAAGLIADAVRLLTSIRAIGDDVLLAPLPRHIRRAEPTEVGFVQRGNRPSPNSFEAAVRRALTTDLPSATEAEDIPTCVGQAQWARFDHDITIGRLWGSVLVAADRGTLELSPHQYERALDMRRITAAACLKLERLLCDLTLALDNIGIDHRIIKGPALAHLLHDDPIERAFGDIDLVVRSADLDRTVSLFELLGARRLTPQVRRGFDRRFAKSVTMRVDDTWEIDLHRTVTPGGYGLAIPERDLWESPTEVQIAGRTMRTLGPAATILHAALHLVIGGNTRLVSHRDVVLLAARTDPDHDGVLDLARRWDVEWVLTEAMRRAGDQVGALPARWTDIADRPIPAAERRRIASYAGTAEPIGHTLRSLRPADRIRFLTAMVFPSGPHLRGRGLTRRQHLEGLIRR